MSTLSTRTDAIETIKDPTICVPSITNDKSGSEAHGCIADAVFWED